MTAPATPRPVRGERFEAALCLARQQPDNFGRRRLRAYVLLSAHEDGGCPPPSAADLAAQLGWDVSKALGVVRRLERDGYVERTKRSRRHKPALQRRRLAPAPPEPPRPENDLYVPADAQRRERLGPDRSDPAVRRGS